MFQCVFSAPIQFCHLFRRKFPIISVLHDVGPNALRKFDAGIHLKTAGTTWLEELIGLAEAGGDGLSLAQEVYASAFYQDISTQSSNASTNQTTAADRLTEAQSRLSSNSGVSLDEELSDLIKYQQAYSAGARLLTTVDKLYDTLLSIQ